jgi:eukaryotic translation initiation factor 2C
MDIIRALQTQVAPTIFTPRAVYDGRKNMFAARELPFGDTGQQEVDISSTRFNDCTEISIV